MWVRWSIIRFRLRLRITSTELDARVSHLSEWQTVVSNIQSLFYRTRGQEWAIDHFLHGRQPRKVACWRVCKSTAGGWIWLRGAEKIPYDNQKEGAQCVWCLLSRRHSDAVGTYEDSLLVLLFICSGCGYITRHWLRWELSRGVTSIEFALPLVHPSCSSLSLLLPSRSMMGLFSSTASSFSRAVKPRGQSVSEYREGVEKPPSDTEPDDTSILSVFSCKPQNHCYWRCFSRDENEGSIITSLISQLRKATASS